MADSQPVVWEEKYQNALKESDPQRLTQYVSDAEAAIFERTQQLNDSSNHVEERRAMNDAAKKLLEIKTGKLGWPKV